MNMIEFLPDEILTNTIIFDSVDQEINTHSNFKIENKFQF